MLKTVGFPSTRTGDQTIVAGNLVIGTAGKGIDFSANGGDVLSQYDEYTAPSAACIGAITTAAIWKVTKVGNVVTLTLPYVVGAASSSINFSFGELLPASFRPSASLGFPCNVRNDDANQDTPGLLLITSAGNIRVFRTISAGANFTANASATACGFAQGCGTSVSWTI
jgi:hypothetical protein